LVVKRSGNKFIIFRSMISDLFLSFKKDVNEIRWSLISYENTRANLTEGNTFRTQKYLYDEKAQNFWSFLFWKQKL
jgi:hypothetical protein